MRSPGQIPMEKISTQESFNRNSNEFSQRTNNIYPPGQPTHNFSNNIQNVQSMTNFMRV